jgi:hypothetical protein
MKYVNASKVLIFWEDRDVINVTCRIATLVISSPNIAPHVCHWWFYYEMPYRILIFSKLDKHFTFDISLLSNSSQLLLVEAVVWNYPGFRPYANCLKTAEYHICTPQKYWLYIYMRIDDFIEEMKGILNQYFNTTNRDNLQNFHESKNS